MNLVKTFLAGALALCTAIAFAAVDVNKASQSELEGIKGIGPAMSTRILDARKTGAFKDWSDLQTRVKGVRDRNSARFSADGLTVAGAAYAAKAATPARSTTPTAPKAGRAMPKAK